MNKYSKLIIALIIPQVAGLLGALATTSNIAGWYVSLVKPNFNPPNWIFGPVWTVLFLLIGIALYFVWISKAKNKQTAYLFFALQMIFNIIWSWLFFYFHNPLFAFTEIIFLWILILLNIIYFYKASKASAYLLIPYIFWVSFAVVLNFYILILNY